MIVWGGTLSGRISTRGLGYDPAKRAWTAASTPAGGTDRALCTPRCRAKRRDDRGYNGVSLTYFNTGAYTIR